jgi:hypothetical protein
MRRSKTAKAVRRLGLLRVESPFESGLASSTQDGKRFLLSSNIIGLGRLEAAMDVQYVPGGPNNRQPMKRAGRLLRSVGKEPLSPLSENGGCTVRPFNGHYVSA